MIPGVILIQAMYYGIVMFFTVLLVSVLLKGFFLKYFKVRISFGRLVMVKIRTQLRDYFAVGKVEEGFLVYKHLKQEVRLSLDGQGVFYRCLSVNWIDVDEEKSSISKTDYTAIAGFDKVKFSDLLTRALMRPAIQSNKEKIMLVLLVCIGIGILVVAYFGYMNYGQSKIITANLAQFAASAKGTIVGSATI